jgi:hypothetical protein
MPRVEDLKLLDLMGVISSLCTASGDPIKAAGASARPRCRPSLTQSHWRRRNSWLLDDGQLHRLKQPTPPVRSSLTNTSHEPAEPAHAAGAKGNSRSTADIAGLHGPASSGGRGHLPRPRGRVAPCQPWSRESRSAQGDERHRELPHGGSRRARGALRGLRPYSDRLQQLPQPALSQVPGRGRARMDGGARGRAAISMSSSRCRRRSATSPTTTRP